MEEVGVLSVLNEVFSWVVVTVLEVSGEVIYVCPVPWVVVGVRMGVVVLRVEEDECICGLLVVTEEVENVGIREVSDVSEEDDV
jgi:hypothetical protein